jgi:hypothetical protein
MRLTKATGLALFLAALLASNAVLAHGGRYYRPRVHFGVSVGVPAYWYYPAPYYYYPPAYYYPPYFAAPASPPVYIERGDASSAPEQAQGQWYYCPEAKAYYPYVKQCAGGWQKVPAQPPG